MRRRISILIATVATVALAASASSALAGTSAKFNQTTGGLSLIDNGTQNAETLSFNAFDYLGAAPDKGVVSYSNLTTGISYTANVYCAIVNPGAHTASFGYVIPNGTGPGLDGLRIIWTVTDGGSPAATNDTAGFAVLSPDATSRGDCSTPPTNPQTITGGNLVVH